MRSRYRYFTSATTYWLSILTLFGAGMSSVGAKEIHPANDPNNQIVYSSGKNGTHQLYLMNADGSNQRPLTTQGDNIEPNWSPDRHSVVYTAAADEGGSQLHVINADGSADRAVTKDGGYAGSWAPDGQHIAFVSDRKGGSQLFVMNADGSNETQLTNDPQADVSETQTAWTPDGQITFVYNKSGGDTIWLINADGSKARQFSHDANGNAYGPSWAPNGKHLAYVLTIDGDSDILTIDVNGGYGTHIATFPGKHADNVTWSPDNKQIAFDVWATKTARAIFVVAADSSGTARQLSAASSDDRGWSSWGSLPLGSIVRSPSFGSTNGLKIGGRARVHVLDDGLKLRSDPRIDNNVIEKMPNGTTVSILDGPTPGTSDSYTWWEVKAPDGNSGWAVEAADGITTLIPI
jgi:TolB protein